MNSGAMSPLALTKQAQLICNVRLLDPASGHDGPGGLVHRDGLILDRGPSLFAAPEGFDGAVLDGQGLLLAPGLIDMRVVLGEPGAEHRETFKSAGRAAAAGGVTTLIAQPNTNPVIDDVSLVDFLLRRAAARSCVRILPAAALTKGLRGESMAEIGLLAEAGAAMFAHGDHPIQDSQVLRRALSYAKVFGLLCAHRPQDVYLSKGGVMHAGEYAGRLGLRGIPIMAETIGVMRDLALAELSGGRLMLDMLSAGASLEPLRRAKEHGLTVHASVSVHHLTLNELDIGDYRTFAKLSPPLRGEADRLALGEALAGGLIDVIVSGHDPQPAENKRLPFDEAAFGAAALETLLPGMLRLHHSQGVPLLALWRAAALHPAQLLGLPQGRLSIGAPADLILVDLDAPYRCKADALLSKSRNTPFDEQLLQGLVRRTLCAGQTVFERE